MKITTLGNCATQTAEKSTTSFLIDTNSNYILLDCGLSTVSQLMKKNIPLTSISTIIITHCHADHTAGFPYLIFSINLARIMQRNTVYDRIKVIGLKSVLDGVITTLNIQYPVEHLSNIIETIYVNEQTEILRFPNYSVTTFKTYHSVPSIGIVIKDKKVSVGFSGDTLYNDKLINYFKGCLALYYEAFCTENSAMLAHNSGHSTAKEAGMVALNANVKKLMLVHPLAVELINSNILINEAKEYFTGEVIVPNDLEDYEI